MHAVGFCSRLPLEIVQPRAQGPLHPGNSVGLRVRPRAGRSAALPQQFSLRRAHTGSTGLTEANAGAFGRAMLLSASCSAGQEDEEAEA